MGNTDLTSDPLRTTRPDAAAVAAVLERFSAQVPDLVAAALHLALPVDGLVGLNCTTDGQRWSWRHVSTAAGAGALTAAEAAGFAVALVDAGSADGDRWLPLDAGSAWLVKVVRSGERSLAWGCELLGGPTVAGDGMVPERVLREVAAGALHGTMDLPAVVAAGVADAGHLVSGDDRLWQVRAAAGDTPTGPVAMPQAGVAAWLAAEFHGEAWAATPRGSRVDGTIDVDVRVALGGGWTAVVPVTLGWAGEVVGLPAAHCLPWDDASAHSAEVLPAGFTLVGTACFDDGLVAVHDASGVRARLVRTDRQRS